MLENKKDFVLSKDDIMLSASVFVIGFDVLIVLTGGSNPHIGSVTLLTQEEEIETHDYPSHDGRRHKDGQLSDRIAKEIKPILKGSATITSGVHYDNISWEGIQTCLDLSLELAKEIRHYLESVDFATVAQPKYHKLEHKK